ncbi:hypothetical protein BGX24_003035, partial [Mortierella sp. AD032]
SSVYLTKDFDIGNSVLHHRSKRPSKPMESVLSIATFCARASRPSTSQEARRTSGSSGSGSEHGRDDSNNSLRSGGRGDNAQHQQTAGAGASGMVGAKWLAKMGQVVFGGPCAQAGHPHHRRTRTSLEPLNSTSNSSNTTANNKKSKDGSSAPKTEKLCKHCSGAMTCLAISILREASSSSSSSTNNALSSSTVGGGKGVGGDPKNTTSAVGRVVPDSGFESGASGFELLDAQSDDVASDGTSSTTSLSPPVTATRQLHDSSLTGAGSPRHGQSSFNSSGGSGKAAPRMNEDYRPRLELKNKTQIRPRQEGDSSTGATSNMSPSSTAGGGPEGSSFIVFDRSHLGDTTIRHPLDSGTDDHFSLQQQSQHDQEQRQESEDEVGIWSPTSSVLSDSIAEAFGPDVAATGYYRSNIRSGMSTPRIMDLADGHGNHGDGSDEYGDDVSLGNLTRSRLERDLAEALGTPVIEPLSPTSSPVVTLQPAPVRLVQPGAAAAAATTPLVPSSFRRPSVTGLGIHASTTLTNSNGDDDDSDDNEQVFHQAIDHFIHPLSTSPHRHPRVSPRTVHLAIPSAAAATTHKNTTTSKSPGLEPSPSVVVDPSPSNYSPPSAPTTTAALKPPTTTMNDDEVVTPILKTTSEDEKKKKRSENEKVQEERGEGAESPKTRPFYGVGIHSRASVDEYAQEVEESMQRRSPPMDLSRSTAAAAEEEEGEEEEEEMKEPEKPNTAAADTTTTANNDTNDATAEVDDIADEVAQALTPLTPAAAAAVAATEEEQAEPTTVPTERRPPALRYGAAVGLHALTPSDEYIQDIEESMQRAVPPIDLSPPSIGDNDGEKEEEEAVVNDDEEVEVKGGDPTEPEDKIAEAEPKDDADEDEVQTDDESTSAAAATVVTSAIDRIEDESLAAAEAKNQLATALRYGAVGLHGKTPFDEYAHEIEESIHRRGAAGPGVAAVWGDVSEEEGMSDVVLEGGSKEGLAIEKEDLEGNNSTDNGMPFAQGHTKNNNISIITTRPLSSVSTLGGGESTTSDTSSLDYDYDDLLDLDLDDDLLDSPSSPPSSSTSNPPTAVQQELQNLRRTQRRLRLRKRIQLVDDAQRKKEQLDRIQARLERKTLGKIREQVSFWERKGVLEQRDVGAEVLEEEEDDEEEEEEEKEGDGGDKVEGVGATVGARAGASATMAKKPRGLSLTQEHLRGIGSGKGSGSGHGRKATGEPLSPGNSQSPGYGDMPQLAPRRSLPSPLASPSSSSSPLAPSSAPSSSPARPPFPASPSQLRRMDSFLSKVD